MPLKAIIFDMDGVLIDSEPIYSGLFEQFFESLGIKADEAERAEFAGINVKDASERIKRFHPSLNKTAAEIEESLHQVYCESFQNLPPEFPLIDGVLFWIREFRRAGLKIAVATSTYSDIARSIIGHFGLFPYLDALATGGEVAKGKPAPDIYRLAASRLGVSPDECLAIEDSLNGILSAKAASMRCYAFSGTDTFHTDYSRADFVFSRYDRETLQKILSLI